MKKILIADNSKTNQKILTELLGEQYRYVYADNGAQVIDQLNNGIDADIILLNIDIPVNGGLEVLEIMNERRWIEETPVLIISNGNDADFLEKAYALGAIDHIHSPFSEITVRFRVQNTLMLYKKQRQLVQLVEEQMREREEINNTLINIFSHTIELRNNEAGVHSLNIRNISNLLLHRLTKITDCYPLTENDIAVIVSLSALHDIGKIAIPKDILNKPGRLTDEEFEIMKTHSAQGDAIIASAAISQSSFVVKTAREICRWHHERWDGKGYPDHLVGDEIPISAQVVSLADVYEALTSERCYKKAFSHDEAIRMICDGECGVFNPLLIKCLTDVAPKLEEMLNENMGEFDERNIAHILTAEALKSNELPLDDRARRLLENEKDKKEFFKRQAGGIQFEFDRPSQKVIFTNRLGENDETETEYLAEGDNIELLSKEDWNTLFRRTGEMTRDNPDITMEVMIPINGELKRHMLTVHSVWPLRGDNYVSVVGQFKEICEK